jgi:Asp-tRNA(Asn)/Glu-tRNA(Gln) amidotransferase B subunit
MTKGWTDYVVSPSAQSAAIFAAVVASWLSLSTLVRLNQEASINLITSIDLTRAAQTDAYKTTQAESITRILSLLDRQQDSIKQLAEQNLALSEQNKTLLQDVNQVLNQHTKSLEEVKTGSKKASANAQEAVTVARHDQARTQRAIKEITKPKPSWWQQLTQPPKHK